MTKAPQRETDPELEDIRQLGLLAHQHRKAARTLGVSSGAMGAIWIISGVLVIVVLVSLALAMR
ncbi:hypothetical protein ACLBXB_08725 [Methylobacterium mesophilicum]|jgi:hypothetical protein